jgi:myo-inositol 2-dehydrogenase / D-chiro-inositol 1-dehydrogenase
MSEARYGILLVTGSHTHQENYAAAFAADKRCKIVAVTDEPDIDQRRRELNERLARALGVPYEPDLGKALQNKDVHVVSVSAPPERRGRIAVRCAEAGKHLYLDKSLAPKLAEADAVVAAVKKAGVRSHMFSFISQPWAREAKELLDKGPLGKLMAIHADTFFAKGHAGTARLGTPRKEEYPPERHQLVEAKRELDNVGVYPITLVRWLTGKKFRTVYGVTGNYFFEEHQKHNVEDFGLLSCTLEDGLPVTVAAGRCGWTSHPAGGVNRLVLVGSERTAVVDANRPRLEAYTDEPPWVPPNVNPADPMGFWKSTQDEVHVRPKRTWVPVTPAGVPADGYVLDCRYFLDRLDAGRESEMAAAEAAAAAEVLLAGYRSAATREVVTLPLPREPKPPG